MPQAVCLFGSYKGARLPYSLHPNPSRARERRDNSKTSLFVMPERFYQASMLLNTVDP